MKKNGFTLVELIATLALLAMLTTLISRVVIKKVNEAKAYERNVLINSIELAAITYTNEYDNVDLQTNDCAYITLQELVEKNLLNNDLIDPTTKKSLALSDTVYVTKDINGNTYATYNINQHYETTLKLNGKYNVYVKINDVYNEPGVKIISKDESGTTGGITTEGVVNTSEEGIYKLTYKYENISIERNVVVYQTSLPTETKITKLTNYIENQFNVNASSNGLEKDTTPDLNIRYVGANPKNYVRFNNELWRIIGIFNGNVKLVRDDILTTYSFDNKTTAQGIETDYGTNDWTKSYLRVFLNDYYYGGKTITCHSETSGSTATNATITCPDINKINDTAKSMIQNTTWTLGGTNYKTNNHPYETYPVNELYESERGTQVYSGHATTSTDYIGLIYPSDYGYASTDASCRQNLRAGLTYTNNIYGGTPTCKNNNWLFNGVWYWTISPYLSIAYSVFRVDGDGRLSNHFAWYRDGVRPSLYLKADVKVVGGTGTSSDPYTLEI